MPIIFERMLNVASGKTVTVGADGLLRQFSSNSGTLGQHWQRLLYDPPKNGMFRFISRISNKVIDARGGQLVDHAALQVFDSHGRDNQCWTVVPTREDASVFFIKAANTDKVWDVPSSSTADGEQIQLCQLNGGNNQKWRFNVAESFNNICIIRSALSRMVLDVPDFSQNDGSVIQQFPENGGFNQLWKFINVVNNNAIKIKSVCSGKVLDYPLQAAQQRRRAEISQYQDNGGLNQQWNFSRNTPPGSSQEVRFGAVMNDFLIEVAGGSTASHAHISVSAFNGGNLNQRWFLTEIP